MRTSSVHSKSFLENGGRFDASFHLSEGVQSRAQVMNAPYPLTTVGAASERIFHAGRWKRAYVSSKEHGIALVGSSDMLKADLLDIKLISRKYTPDMEDKILKKGWILISCSGTIGNTVFTNEQHAEKLASQDVIRIIPNNILRTGFVYSFLSTSYGYNLLTQGTFGAVIQHIEPQNVEQIPIPIMPDAFQEKVDNLIQESARLRDESMTALYEAHALIEAHFPEEPTTDKTGVISSQTILTSQLHRFDANYHLAAGKQYDAYIKNHFAWRSLGDVSQSISRPGIAKRMYVKDGITFMGGTDLFLSVPDSDKKLSRKAPNLDEYLIQEGWILLPRSGTIGDVVFTNEQHAQKLVSEDVVRIIPNNILRRGFVFSFLSSKIGKALIQRPIFGSVIQHVEPPLLSVIPIPVFEEAEMEKIASLAEKHRECWGKAAKMELEAISLVEKEIEKWNN